MCAREAFHFAEMKVYPHSILLINARFHTSTPLRVGPHAERKGSQIGCVSPQRRACGVEKPYIVLDVRDVSIAPDKDDLSEASPVVRMGRVRLSSWYVKRRNKDCIFQLRAFSRRWDRRAGTERRNWDENELVQAQPRIDRGRCKASKVMNGRYRVGPRTRNKTGSWHARQ